MSSKTVVHVINFFIHLAIMMVCDSPGDIYCFQLVYTTTVVTQHTVGGELACTNIIICCHITTHTSVTTMLLLMA